MSDDEDYDPWDNVPERAFHKFDDWDNLPEGTEPLPDGFIAWVEQDCAPDSPRDWCNVALFVTLHRNYDLNEDDDWRSALTHYREYGYDPADPDGDPDDYWGGDTEKFAEFFARTYLDAVAFATFSTGDHGEATVYAYVPRSAAFEHLMGDAPTGDPDALTRWLERADDIENLALEAITGEASTYNQWDRGEVYGVVVQHVESGREESLWGCYDEESWENYPYLRTVVDDLILELS